LKKKKKEGDKIMIYKASKAHTLWDTWMYYHQDMYYLYYLHKIQGEIGVHPPSEGVGLATSRDGVHWNEYGCILPRDEGAAGQGTGSVWKAADFEKTGIFIMNYSTWGGSRGSFQQIRFAESKDLVHWKKLGEEFTFCIDSRWYENDRWDCIYTIPRPCGGRYGYWTAKPKERFAFGFGESLDGRKWTALPPPEMLHEYYGEVGAVEKFGKKFYMLYSGGLTTLVADAPQGPFRQVNKNYGFLVGCNASYFTRFFPTPNGMLVNHQSWPLVGFKDGGEAGYAGDMWFAPLKGAVMDREGVLRMVYWEGNEKLKGDKIETGLPGKKVGDNSQITLLTNCIDFEQGLVLEAEVILPSHEDELCGLYLETDPDNHGICFLFKPNGVVEFGSMKPDSSDFKLDEDNPVAAHRLVSPRWDRELKLGATCRLRILLRHGMFEFYLDDVLIRAYGLRAKLTGRIGLVGHSTSGLSDVRMWEMSL
jgi:hypothetical protein